MDFKDKIFLGVVCPRCKNWQVVKLDISGVMLDDSFTCNCGCNFGLEDITEPSFIMLPVVNFRYIERPSKR